MAQTRIVLKDEDKPLVEQLLQTTGVGSPSEAIALLLRRYGPHFIEWFKSNPHQCNYPLPSATALPVVLPSESSQPFPTDPGADLAPINL